MEREILEKDIKQGLQELSDMYFEKHILEEMDKQEEIDKIDKKINKKQKQVDKLIMKFNKRYGGDD